LGFTVMGAPVRRKMRAASKKVPQRRRGAGQGRSGRSAQAWNQTFADSRTTAAADDMSA